MGILEKLKKIAVKLEKKNNSIFTFPVSRQKAYMNRLKTPSSDWERSYNQYCCQMKLNNKLVKVMLNIISLPLIVFYYFKKADEKIEKRQYDAIFISEGIPEHVIPNELRREYVTWFNVKDHGENFSYSDKKYFKNLIKKFPVSWHFLLKCLIKIRFYSFEIEYRKPNAIVVCGEYSFTSSVLTDYCKQKNILHIDVMHGEKLFYMRDSFFHFDRCYIWDDFYAKLFVALHADKNQFIIAVPESMRNDKKNSISKSVDYTYYLGAEEKEKLLKIAECLSAIKARGFRVAVRPHPRYSDMSVIKELFKSIEIEVGNHVDIETSILRTMNAISGYSTVLNQAYHSGTGIVIDDFTNPATYEKLVELQYIVLSYKHILLSQIMTDINIC